MPHTPQNADSAVPNIVPVGSKVLLGIDEAAAVLSISVRTVRNLVEQRAIPFIRIGTRVLFRRAGLEAWAEKQEKDCEESECQA